MGQAAIAVKIWTKMGLLADSAVAMMVLVTILTCWHSACSGARSYVYVRVGYILWADSRRYVASQFKKDAIRREIDGCTLWLHIAVDLAVDFAMLPPVSLNSIRSLKC